MNLTPEERAVGKANFQSAVGSELTRREFLQGSLLAASTTGAGLGAFYFGYKKLGGDPLRVGVIGTGDEGNVLIGAHTPEYVDIVAIADIRPYNIHRAFHGDVKAPAERPGLMKVRGWSTRDEAEKHVKVYEDYHDLFQHAGLEAVIIALPLHLHDKVAIEAMRAANGPDKKGLHVLTEKLMGYSVHQCKTMARVANERKLHLATGHQRHYSILYANAVETIKQGLLGDLHHIRAQWHRTADTWYQPLPDEKLIADLKSFQDKFNNEKDPARKEALALNIADLEQRYLDKDVDALKYGYEAKKLGENLEFSPLAELIRWRLWTRTGGGLMAELGSHQLDASGIFCSAVRKDGKKALPLTVSAVGGRHVYPLDRECDDHVYCMYEYPGPKYDEDPNKKIVVTYSTINGNGFGGYGEVVMGTQGTLILEREKEVMIFKGSDTKTSVKVAKDAKNAPTLVAAESGGADAALGKQALDSGPVSRGYTEEIEHWAWCIRNFDFENNKPKCHPEVALADAVIALTTNIALREGTRITFNPDWFDVDSDETPEKIKPSGADTVT